MKTKTKILKAFIEKKESLTIKDISRTIKADYRITHTAVQRLLSQNILQLRKVGNNSLCSLNPDYYGPEIYQAEEERKQAFLQNRNIKLLHHEIMAKANTSHFTFLFFQPKTNMPKSPEINLLFISNQANLKKKIEEIVSLIPLQINAYVSTEEEFRRNKHSPEENIVKQALQQNVILHGIESYYRLIR